MDIKQIFENNRNWVIKQLQTDENYFDEILKDITARYKISQ